MMSGVIGEWSVDPIMFKPATLGVSSRKTCTIFPMIPSRYHGKKRNKIVEQFKKQNGCTGWAFLSFELPHEQQKEK
jgi:hypothetical protein